MIYCSVCLKDKMYCQCVNTITYSPVTIFINGAGVANTTSFQYNYSSPFPIKLSISGSTAAYFDGINYIFKKPPIDVLAIMKKTVYGDKDAK